jgi:hypothetical protein
MTMYGGSGGIVPITLNLVARCSVNTALQTVYPPYPLSKRLGRPQSAVRKFAKTEKNTSHMPGLKPQTVQSVA